MTLDGESERRTRRFRVGHLPIDDCEMEEVITRLNSHSASSQRACLVVSPNLTNVAIFKSDIRVQDAYQRADFILADGWPLQLAALANKQSKPPLVPGSELLPAWLRQLTKPTNFLIVGGKNGLAISQALMGSSNFVSSVKFDDGQWQANSEDFARLGGLIDESQPDILLLLLGSPKQEVLAMSAIANGFCGVILCIGAAGDFMADMPKRAPKVIQRAKLEWLYRVGQEPARLGPRYLKALVPFVKTVRKQS